MRREDAQWKREGVKVDEWRMDVRTDTRRKVEGWKEWEGRLEEGDARRGKEGWHTAWDRRTGGSRWECGEEMKQRKRIIEWPFLAK